jgi:hypothetical protein
VAHAGGGTKANRQWLPRLNPCIAVRDVRVAMRGPKAFNALASYGAAAGAPVIAALVCICCWASGPDIERWAPGGLGRLLFAVMMAAQLTVALFVMPVRVAVSIGLERETGAMDLLAMSRLSRFDIVTGRLLGTMAFMGLAMLTSLPVAILCMLMGGLALDDIVYSYLLLVTLSAWVCAVALMIAGLCHRAITAVVITYVVLMIWSTYLPVVLMVTQVSPLVISLIAAAALSALIPYRIVAWLIGPSRRERHRRLSILAGVAASLLVMGLVFGILLMPAYKLMLMAHFASSGMLVPYVGLLLPLYADRFPASTAGLGAISGPELVQLYMWALVQMTYLLAGVLFWLMATQSFSMGGRRG